MFLIWNMEGLVHFNNKGVHEMRYSKARFVYYKFDSLKFHPSCQQTHRQTIFKSIKIKASTSIFVIAFTLKKIYK